MSVAGPDHQGGRPSRPRDMGVPVSKNFFCPFGPQFGLRIMGGGEGPLGPPLDPLVYVKGLRV